MHTTLANTPEIQSGLIFNVDSVVNEDSDPALVWEAMVERAVNARVSDIHVLAQSDSVDLAFRLDGEMYSQGSMPHSLARRLISHVKAVAEIDLGESRRPTEGRVRLEMPSAAATLGGQAPRTVDLRVSCIPTLHGQDMVVRIFDRDVNILGMSELGMLAEQVAALEDMVSRPHGLVLVSGPTGSGKTTTLYAMLRHLSGGGRKIVTIENPVEYDLPGVNQTQVNTRVGVHFSNMLTAILRQDPDIIMVGEIRDAETAQTAVRAANTGHLVLATTHSVRASRAVETMLSLGVHPYFLAVALRGVVAQVLVKRICPHCASPLPETADMFIDQQVRQRLDNPVAATLHQGHGCSHCFGSGYQGRLGLFEMLQPDDNIKQQIIDRRPGTEIEAAMIESGAITLEQAGSIAALNGRTTMEEMLNMAPIL